MIMIGGVYLCILLFFKKELLCSSLKEQFFFFSILASCKEIIKNHTSNK